MKTEKLTKNQVNALVAMAAAGALDRMKNNEGTPEDAELLENCLEHLHADHGNKHKPTLDKAQV